MVEWLEVVIDIKDQNRWECQISFCHSHVSDIWDGSIYFGKNFIKNAKVSEINTLAVVSFID
ncbi:hypothetical protein RC92_04425 [Pectobacterium brasiliense]|nr:hypothetical protein RC92_04425 [Pectobacterium brasiliense]